VLLSPAVLILWGLSRAVEWGLGQSPEQVRLSLGRREMEKVLDESQEIGLLHPAQRNLSQNFFLIAARSVKSLAVPAAKIATVAAGKPAAVYIEAGRKQPYGIVLVTSQETGAVTGYLRLVDLLVWSDRKKLVTQWSEILDIPAEETAGEALMQMQARHHTVARVKGSGQQPASFLFRDMLVQPLLREPIGTGRRASEPPVAKS
jgi:CBS domain containing-hemolysin-like protein